MSTLTCSIIQTALHWENKQENLAMLERKIREIEHSEIIVLPEMFSTGFSMQPERLAERIDGATVNWMRNISAEKKVILTGSLIIEENGRYYNCLVWMLPNGQFGTYYKRHLFAFAGEDQHYTPGQKRLIASVKGWRVNLQVCYDLRFPVWARQQSESNTEYDLLIYVANWPERRNHAWKTLLQARAIENQTFVIGVNRVGEDGNGIYHSGDSMVVGPLGNVIEQVEHVEATKTVTLVKEELEEIRLKMPFWKDADPFMILQ